MVTEDPNGPPPPDSGLYGLDPERARSRAVVIPVPYEATVSYRAGTREGPEAIRRASHQVDLYDADVGYAASAGILLDVAPEGVAALSESCRARAVRVIEAQTRGEAPDAADLAAVNDAGERVRDLVHSRVAAVLEEGRLPVLLGGDHSVPLGAIEAVAARHADETVGVLHIDAHADLRVAYEGFEHSHASIMHNALARARNLRLVQVGIRDFSDDELAVIREDGRISTYFDAQLRPFRLSGRIHAAFDAVVSALPELVYVSFDIDGLDPVLCPHTGTPVPGGLSFDEVVALLAKVVESGRRVVGLDLVEVAPGPDPDDEWDALVAARLLYKMVGLALRSRGELAHDDGLPVPPGL